MVDKHNVSKSIVVAIDCMGGDLGVSEVVSGIAKAYSEDKSISFVVHGVGNELESCIKQYPELTNICTLIQADGIVSMQEKPSQALRTGKNTSMWNALKSVSERKSDVAVSCGNTGALLAMSMIQLRKTPGINRPAIAVLWPSRNELGFNILLDAGADIRADANDLFQYALMGTSYAKDGFNIKHPRIGLLNVGVEDHKGRTELHKASQLIDAGSSSGNYQYIGFIEGDDIPSSKIDVIITDGFTGNVALKTGEGTASLIGSLLKDAFEHSIFSKLSGLIALSALSKLRKRIDPRRVNGGVFLGLNGIVVKSHGGADATGISAAIKLAVQLAKNELQKKVANQINLGEMESLNQKKQKSIKAI